MIEFGPLLTAWGAAKDLLPALIAERDRQKAAAIELQFMEKLTQAQLHLLHVVQAAGEQAEALRVARERIGELEADQSERLRYQLVNLPDCRAAFGYGLRGAAELLERADEPLHFLCQPCLDSRRKVVLIPAVEFGSRTWRCRGCGWHATGQPVDEG